VKKLVPQLVLLLGYVLALVCAALFDIRLVVGVLGAIAIYEAREAEK